MAGAHGDADGDAPNNQVRDTQYADTEPHHASGESAPTAHQKSINSAAIRISIDAATAISVLMLAVW